jgi:PTH2 family peptidyl-tRNA hydrolase
MSPGKIASQAGHAYLDAYVETLKQRPQVAQEYKEDHHGIKVCLRAKRLADLERAYAEAIKLGIPAALITDLGYTCFNGQPTVTALGLGPAKQEEIKQITKRFQLLG